MKCKVALQLTLFAMLLSSMQSFSQVEPIYSGTFTRIKSPGPGMTFTSGLPVRVVADGIDIDGYQWLEGSSEAQKVEFYADGTLKSSDDYLRGYNHFETILTGLPLGIHTLTTKSYNFGGVVKTSPFPVVITIQAMPVKPNTVDLTADLLLSGTTDLIWQNVIVKGNGHRVTSTDTWKGKVLIQNSFITGLAVTAQSVPTTTNAANPGIDVSTSNSVVVENSIFEWTGANYFTVSGTGAITVRKNEFRANAYIPYVSDDPTMSPVIQFEGRTTGAKVFQANNVGAGYLNIYYMKGWLIGGDNDSLSNIFIGPRTGIRVESSSDITIRGNYSRHDYYGGWSQGFNFWFGNNSPPFLCEHNVIRQGSWPVQSICGTFRFNLVIVAGHEWLRTADSGTEIYRNLFINPEIAGYPNAGCWFYDNQTNIKVYNNTFDGGGNGMSMNSPAIAVSDGSNISLLRNNLFTNFLPDPYGSAIVDRALVYDEKDSRSRITYADYNCFYNPDAGGANSYGENIVSGKTKGTPGYGGHDLGGLNGQVNPALTQGIAIPYQIEEDKVWKRTMRLSEVLTGFRNRYMPKSTSLLIDAGDPESGQGVDIGAIEALTGTQQTDDLFGKLESTIPDHVTAVKEIDTQESFNIQAKPNPFSNSTEISFKLPAGHQKGDRINLSVYTTDGKLVITLVNDKAENVNTNAVIWKAESVLAGIYLVRLSTNTGVQVLRVALVK